MRKLPPQEWTIISLRPKGQHAATYRAVTAWGAEFIECSSVSLVELHDENTLREALACSRIVVTSPAAATFAAKSAAFSAASHSQWFAVGPGTAAVLEKHGIENIFRPENQADSESLLALPGLQKIAGQAIGLLGAPGGRNLIEPELARRGAKVTSAHLYRRETRGIGAAALSKLAAMNPPFAVFCSSHEVFQSFWRQLSIPLQEKLAAGLWVLSSARLQALLLDAGIRDSSVCGSAKPESMLAHLEHVRMQQVR